MRQKVFCSILPFIILLASASCNLPEGPGFGMGTLTLFLPETMVQGAAASNQTAARSVLSDTFTGTLKYRLIFTHTAGKVISLEAGGGGTTVSLDTGLWTIRAEAYDPGNPAVAVGSGSATITVVAGQNISVRISMKVDPAYEAGLLDIYIHNEAELRRIGAAANGLAIDNPGRTFYLENDIVLTQPWTPIGSFDNKFKAKFYGKGHSITINGFTAEALSGDYIGLFGYTEGATIGNLKIQCNLGDIGSPLNLTGPGGSFRYVGALAGFANSPNFYGITVSGSIGVDAAGASLHFGGLVGRAIDGTIQESSFTGTLWGKTYPGGTDGVSVGGIVGSYAGTAGMIKACYVSAMVEAVAASTYTADAGGIEGRGGATIQQCYAWADVSASNASGAADVTAGGIIGKQEASASISQCYAQGTVTAGGPSSSPSCYSGGISGYALGGSITNCAALNTAIESVNSANARRILGDGASLTNNFAAGDLFPTGNPQPALVSSLTSKDGVSTSRADFERDTVGTVYNTGYLGWDFTSTGDWKFLPSGSGYTYPVLSWQNSPPVDPASF